MEPQIFHQTILPTLAGFLTAFMPSLAFFKKRRENSPTEPIGEALTGTAKLSLKYALIPMIATYTTTLDHELGPSTLFWGFNFITTLGTVLGTFIKASQETRKSSKV